MVCRESKPLRSGQGGIRANWIRVGLAAALCFCVLRAWPQQTNTVEAAFQFQDDPAAHQLYEEMIQAMRKATTLLWTGEALITPAEVRRSLTS